MHGRLGELGRHNRPETLPHSIRCLFLTCNWAGMVFSCHIWVRGKKINFDPITRVDSVLCYVLCSTHCGNNMSCTCMSRHRHLQKHYIQDKARMAKTNRKGVVIPCYMVFFCTEPMFTTTFKKNIQVLLWTFKLLKSIVNSNISHPLQSSGEATIM